MPANCGLFVRDRETPVRIGNQTVMRGFGSILVRRSIVGQLGGELDYIWKPEGFSAFISIPMERLSS